MLKLEGIEATNICNLQCGYCINARSSYPMGYIDDATVHKALPHCSFDTVSPLYGLGECLLHPGITDYVRWFHNAGHGTYVSTNGLLLTEQVLDALVDAGLTHLSVSLHDKRSIPAFLLAARYDRTPLAVNGNIMSVSETSMRQALAAAGMTSPEEAHLRVFPTMLWPDPRTVEPYPAEQVRRRKAQCFYLQHDLCTLRWDGTVVSCCLDAGAINRLGHIDDFASLRHTPDTYDLCNYCGPNWCNGFI